MKSSALRVSLLLLFLQCALSAPAFAQARVSVGGVELDSEAGVSGVLGDVFKRQARQYAGLATRCGLPLCRKTSGNSTFFALFVCPEVHFKHLLDDDPLAKLSGGPR